LSEGHYDDNERFRRGDAIRRSVLGEERIEAASARDARDDFTRPLTQWATENIWGEIWSRPGLSRRDRSLINLAMLAAMNRPRELEMHLPGAVKNGLDREEIREVLLQVTAYAGAPAGVEAFAVAHRFFEDPAE
jgi:4-carboxymuconolactone decarboxylase